MSPASAVLTALLLGAALSLQGCFETADCPGEKIRNGQIPDTAGGKKVATAVICHDGYEYHGPELTCNWVSEQCTHFDEKKKEDVGCKHIFDFGEHGKSLEKWPKDAKPMYKPHSYAEMAKVKAKELKAKAEAAAAAKPKKKRRLADHVGEESGHKGWYHIHTEGILTADDLKEGCKKVAAKEKKFSLGPLVQWQDGGVSAGAAFLGSFALVVSVGGLGLVIAKMYRPRSSVPVSDDLRELTGENTFAEEEGNLVE